ncbi:WD40 repeat-like protein [Ramicandelaber brevisporus]|nr:WD40 repeat-like protein [Ramicandelaber brevisporus]
MQLAVYNRDHSHERDDEPELHSERQHKPWRLMRVIGGHEGWIRSIAVEPGNQWFATGSVDSTVKVWDVASGALKLTLTGHISAVRGIAISPRQPYMFTVGEDKTVKCWDLEQNKVVRQYHGHLGGVYSVALHPRLDVLVTGGRDQVARVWDMRTRGEIMALEGHSGTISAIQCQAADPQVITGSHDQTVRLWDLAAGRTTAVLTHHSTSVRALVQHPTEFAFASASADSVRKWRCPEGTLIDVFGTERAATATTTTTAAAGSIANGLALNDDGLLVAGCDDGALTMWDWTSAAHVQTLVTPPHPGSLSSENGVLCCTFDRTGLRLITGGADKMVKVYCEAS